MVSRWMVTQWWVQIRERYQVDEVRHTEEMAAHLRSLEVRHRGPMTLLLLLGENTDSHKMTRPANFTGIEQFRTDKDTLFNVIMELRVIKTPMEQGREQIYIN